MPAVAASDPLPSGRLDRDQRERALERLAREPFDLVVVGGGVTGCGVALDAATRGLSVALLEKGDWSCGTSSRSGKLIHGGLRYLEQLQFDLVRESLRERALMLRRLCPHLVRPAAFMYLLEHPVWERAYIGSGLGLYDMLGGAGAVPRHRHLTRRGALAVAPGLRPAAFRGGLTFYDAEFDDARHTMMLARTARAYGVEVASRAEATAYERAGDRVRGLRVRDLESEAEITVRARHVVNAAGVWTDPLHERLGVDGGLRVRASKGVHLVVPADRIETKVGFTVRAERDPMIFVRPWDNGRFWIFGTTDTPWHLELERPATTAADIDYLLRNVNRFLTRPLTREDLVGAYAGLRPLVAGASEETSHLSREHAIASPTPGLTTVAGGKYTTYRVMAADAVDHAAADFPETVPASCSDRIPLLGAEGWPALWNRRHRLIAQSGLEPEQLEHLLHRHGTLVYDVLALIRDRPELGQPVTGAEHYLRAEALYGATHEGALHLEDIIERRLRASIESHDRGSRAAEELAPLAAEALGWDAPTSSRELEHCRRLIAADLAAERQPDDDSATSAARITIGDPEPAEGDGLGSRRTRHAPDPSSVSRR